MARSRFYADPADLEWSEETSSYVWREGERAARGGELVESPTVPSATRGDGHLPSAPLRRCDLCGRLHRTNVCRCESGEPESYEWMREPAPWERW